MRLIGKPYATCRDQQTGQNKASVTSSQRTGTRTATTTPSPRSRATRSSPTTTSQRRRSTPNSTRVTQSFPRKSAYFSTKAKNPTESKNNANNSSRHVGVTPEHNKVKHENNTRIKCQDVKTEKDKGKSKGHTAYKTSSPKKESIFVTPPRDFNEIATEVVHADCMNHGYRIDKLIGEGAYAKVKLAEVTQSKLARNLEMADLADDDGSLKVAIKVIEAKNVPKEFVRKFLPRELDNHCPMPPHINVVRVLEQFRTQDRHYVVMEYCSHGDLLDLINTRISESRKGLGEERVRSLFRMLAEGMHHIHVNGIVHRDLKCENILLDKHDNIKITDFGFSTRYVPGQTSLLKTSCGSYAYTAPEVIRSKPYDGTKSDVWSLGIILFAMLNGRLPFNDVQISELEEDMKMQRLRFERTVSFESMVLVRRILQFNPSSRPSMADILNDTWLTGKKLIPRQSNKQKLNHHPVCNSPVMYKGAISERGSDATVTVNHENNETVTLKSRTRTKKNMWITGSSVTQRPNTWPRPDKSSGKQAHVQAPREKSRGITSTGTRSNTTTVVGKPTDGRKPPGKPESKPRVTPKTIQMSKWFIEKYMAGKEENKEWKGSDDCRCCKAEAAVPIPSEEEEELVLLDNGDVIKPSSPDDDFRFPSPVKNVPIQETERDTGKQSRDGRLSRTKAVSAGSCGRVTSGKSGDGQTKAGSNAKGTRSTTSTEITRRTNLVNYMVSRSTSPAQRVKYFRDRLMKIYGNEKVEIQASENSGLPPLLVQSLNSSRTSTPTKNPSTPSREPTPTSTRSVSPSRQAWAGGWRAKHQRSNSNVKPKQIMVLHSQPL